jgi:hypothetical protein
MRAICRPAIHGAINRGAASVRHSEDDLEIARSTSGGCTPLRGALFALAGLLAAVLVLGLALAQR